MCFLISSRADPSKAAETADITCTFVSCPLRPNSDVVRLFSSHKALQAHQRTKHHMRAAMILHAACDGLCRVCGTKFSSILRLLTRLSASRRPRCRYVCLSGGVEVLPLEEVSRLDDLDRQAKTTA